MIEKIGFIDVKLVDFEKYRIELTNYANGLLTNFYGKTKKEKIVTQAEDIIQECYIVFHKYRKDTFVSEQHLWNFLKLCLYRCYQNTIDSKRKLQQHIIIKDDNIIDHKNLPSYEIQTDNSIEKFLSTLNTNQKNIVGKLLEGYNSKEIANQKNISKQGVWESLVYIKKKLKKFIK